MLSAVTWTESRHQSPTQALQPLVNLKGRTDHMQTLQEELHCSKFVLPETLEHCKCIASGAFCLHRVCPEVGCRLTEFGEDTLIL